LEETSILEEAQSKEIQTIFWKEIRELEKAFS
jgi:hypothetical protein